MTVIVSAVIPMRPEKHLIRAHDSFHSFSIEILSESVEPRSNTKQNTADPLLDIAGANEHLGFLRVHKKKQVRWSCTIAFNH